MKKIKRRFLNALLLPFLSLSVMISLRNLPVVAEFGFASTFLYIVVTLVFLLPAALVSVEFATGWTRTEGIYVWG